MQFSHLHCHTQYSLLDGHASIERMMAKAKADNMPAVALTDHGNLFGAFKFVAEANKKKIKPIVGCEFYMVADRFQKQFTKEQKDVRHHQLLLAKNAEGYKNLSKLCSLGFIDGMYSKWPRIDKELLLKHKDNLIATTCCLGAEVPQAILNKSPEEAEKIFRWWLDLFGEDYYIEMQRHNLPEQIKVNKVLLEYAKKYNVKIIASNDSHYVDEDDAPAHDILLCVNTGELRSTPIYNGEEKKKGERFGFPNNQFYFKTTEEMSALFHDIPEAIDNTNEIVDKIDPFKLERDILLPVYPLPVGFSSNDDYLEKLTFDGALKRYGEIQSEVEERIKYELFIIKQMGFAGYFLIVQDFINAGRDLGVLIGPGRGSAAGSVVAYCIGITNIDPIKYELLFERFLNPERVSMPDIDVDFDDEGRQKVIDYVIDKYGKNQVAQIITFGTMAAKSAIKDVARVLDLPLNDANALAKLVPEKLGASLKNAQDEVQEFRDILNGTDERAEVLELAIKLEGSVRNTGIHAAGVIIAPDDLLEYIPVSTSKDSDLWVTQFDGKVIESAGMLKMDFLGLKTLTIIRDALKMIKENHGIDLNIDAIAEDDEKTFDLYKRGDTVGTFQFESDGMRKYLVDLKPSNIEDLIAMHALYRPGPLQFIPDYINRKHGKEEVQIPHPALEPVLKNTYGIFVYQEQIQQAARVMAGYTLGGADLLRRAMGKKDKEKMAKERTKFNAGCLEKFGLTTEESDKIFNIMERFAEYGFNRSHSAAYSVLAYQTAYLKANYPAEYMASVLTHSMGNIEKITGFMDECRKMGIQVLGPDVNESKFHFSVNKDGQIRFGLGAIKGNGEAAAAQIIEERMKGGTFHTIYDLVTRITTRSLNKKSMESMVYAGAFDSLGLKRWQYFAPLDNGNALDKIIRFGQSAQQSKEVSQTSLFGSASDTSGLSAPKIPDGTPWSDLEMLNKERDVVGFYLSGHPLDNFKYTLKYSNLTKIKDIEEKKDQDVTIAGVIESRRNGLTKQGDPFCSFVITDYDSSIEIALFNKDYIAYNNWAQQGHIVQIKGRYGRRFRDSSDYKLNINQMSLLSEVLEKNTKEVNVYCDISALDHEFTTVFTDVLETSPGAKKLILTLFDSQAQEIAPVPLLTNKYKIAISEETLERLSKIVAKMEVR